LQQTSKCAGAKASHESVGAWWRIRRISPRLALQSPRQLSRCAICPAFQTRKTSHFRPVLCDSCMPRFAVVSIKRNGEQRLPPRSPSFSLVRLFSSSASFLLSGRPLNIARRWLHFLRLFWLRVRARLPAAQSTYLIQRLAAQSSLPFCTFPSPGSRPE